MSSGLLAPVSGLTIVLRTYVLYGQGMEQTERNRITANLVQQRQSLASSYQRNAPVQLNRDTLIDLINLVVELEHAQRAT